MHLDIRNRIENENELRKVRSLQKLSKIDKILKRLVNNQNLKYEDTITSKLPSIKAKMRSPITIRRIFSSV